jgi:hypothetical protein
MKTKIQIKPMDAVRILVYPKTDINAYGRVQQVDYRKGICWISNTNMPWQGTFSWVEFSLDNVELIK